MSDIPQRKQRKQTGSSVPEYMATYGDMVTLMLCFFVLLINPPVVDNQRMQLIMASFNNLGFLAGGNTLEEGELAELGNNLNTLPSLTSMRRLNQARRTSPSNLEIDALEKLPLVTQDERGLPISLAGYIFFRSGSASLDNPQTRQILQRIVQLMQKKSGDNLVFRLEGHTSSQALPPNSEFSTRWELSTARSLAVLHALTDMGVNQHRFQVTGLADTMPQPISQQLPLLGLADNVNDRVDVILLRQAHIQ